MPRFVKYALVTVGSLVALVGVSGAGLYAWSSRAISKTLPDQTHAFTAPTDSASIARGEHVIKALAKCADCHGADYGGQTMIEDPAIGRISAANITAGRGGVLGGMTDADLERAIRHGTAKNGRRLLLMPSGEYQTLSDEDVGVIIAYLRTVAPVDRELPPNRVGPVARALYAAGKMPLFGADGVTHRNEVVGTVRPDSTVEYGRYLVNGGCAGCHGATYAGGPIHGAPPDWPHSSNITPAGLAAYDYAAFVKVLTDGVRPNGSKLHPIMPVQATKLMTPTEMTAIWKYLQSVPAVAETAR